MADDEGVALTVGTNLAAIVPLVVFAAKGHYLGAVAALASGLISAQWHGCAGGLHGWCGPLEWQEVGYLDYVLANALGVAAVAAILDGACDPSTPAHRRWMQIRDGCLPAALVIILVGSMVRPRAFWLIAVTIAVCGALLVSVVPQKMRQDPALRARYAAYWWLWVLALVSLVGALLLREAGSTKHAHHLAHSLWHVVVYLVAAAAGVVAPPYAIPETPRSARGRAGPLCLVRSG